MATTPFWTNSKTTTCSPAAKPAKQRTTNCNCKRCIPTKRSPQRICMGNNSSGSALVARSRTSPGRCWRHALRPSRSFRGVGCTHFPQSLHPKLRLTPFFWVNHSMLLRQQWSHHHSNRNVQRHPQPTQRYHKRRPRRVLGNQCNNRSMCACDTPVPPCQGPPG